MSSFNNSSVTVSTVESSPLLKNSKFLKRDVPESGGDSDPQSMDEVLFRDYLKQQIDHLMTGDAGRDGVAEGRRGTHVEVCAVLDMYTWIGRIAHLSRTFTCTDSDNLFGKETERVNRITRLF